MQGKLTSEQLSDIMMQSVALSALLIEKFEVMEENKLVAHKAKQSLKNTNNFLRNYVDKVFYVSDAESDEGQHMKTGASHIAELSNRVETALNAENLLSISNRKEILHKIVFNAPLLNIQRQELYQAIRDSGIIDY